MLVWHEKCAAPPLPPPFFRKSIIPNELLIVTAQEYHSMALSFSFAKGAI